MIILNHQHLYYFWVVAKEGSVARACEKLFLAQATVSGQIIQLEKFFGRRLFTRAKKKMDLTDDGKLVFEYSDRIFDVSRELMGALQDRVGRKVIRMNLGIVPQIPLQLAERLLHRLTQYRPKVLPTIAEGPLKQLLNGLQTHHLDLVFSHVSIPEEEGKGYIQIQVGEMPIDFVAAPSLAAKVKRFPQDLSKIPLLLPARPNPIRELVENFLYDRDCKPEIAGEAQDVELLRFLTLKGVGAAPLVRMVTALDVRSGKLTRLNRRPTGLTKTEWLIARKRHALNPVAQYLLKHFRINAPSGSLPRRTGHNPTPTR
jgi:LysR family transcriptional regulator, transcriptional activator of nhaA